MCDITQFWRDIALFMAGVRGAPGVWQKGWGGNLKRLYGPTLGWNECLGTPYVGADSGLWNMQNGDITRNHRFLEITGISMISWNHRNHGNLTFYFWIQKSTDVAGFAGLKPLAALFPMGYVLLCVSTPHLLERQLKNSHRAQPRSSQSLQESPRNKI